MLPQQNRVSAIDHFGAVRRGALQRGRLHRNIFGEKSCQRDIALRIAIAFTEIADRKRFVVRRITGSGSFWISELVLSYDDRPFHVVSIMEFESGQVVLSL